MTHSAPTTSTEIVEALDQHQLARAVRLLVIATVVTSVTLAGCLLWILQERNARIRYTDRQLQIFACLIVKPYPDSAAPLVAQLRHNYHCPDWVRPKVIAPRTPTVTRTATKTVGGPRPGTGIPSPGRPTITVTTVPRPSVTPTRGSLPTLPDTQLPRATTHAPTTPGPTLAPTPSAVCVVVAGVKVCL